MSLAHGQLAEVIFNLTLEGSVKGGYSSIFGVNFIVNLDVHNFSVFLWDHIWSFNLHGLDGVLSTFFAIALGLVPE